MLERFNKAVTNTKVALEMLIDEHDRKKELKQNIATEQRNLEDLIGNKGALRDEYSEQRKRFIGRFFLVGFVDLDFENKEYNTAIRTAEFHDMQGEKDSFQEHMDLADSLYDEMLAVANSKAETIADAIIGNRNDNIGSYVVFSAGSKGSFEQHDASLTKTAIALKDQLFERKTNASLGNNKKLIMPFNDNYMHEIMNCIDPLQAGDPEKSSFAAVAVVDPTEPMNPYIPTEYSRSIAKELKDGGVVQLQDNPVYGKPPIWVPVY